MIVGSKEGFGQNSLKTKILFCVGTDRQRDMKKQIDRLLNQQYIIFIE